MRSRRRDREHVGGNDNGQQGSSRDGNAAKRSGSGGGGGGGSRNQGGRNQGRSGKGGGRNKNKRSRNSRGGNAKGPSSPSGAGFWGDAAKLPEPTRDVRITDQPAAVARSLGAPPLPGHENIAEHYFAVVYERAVQTAGALAAAGGLIDPDALVEELGE